MGICLDTDQQDKSKVFEESSAENTEKWRKQAGILATPPGYNFPMQNAGPVKFEPPTVPVIFILGGPGSGKVTHSDNFTREKKGVVHINMTDLLQQYAVGNDMKDYGLLSSKTVTEVLMLEMKMSLGAKTFLVSGYPRNMRDVVEYSEKIQIVNGVILVAWEQEVLQKQIDYGAQLGQVIIELARMELHNFYKNVMPVAEYFDQSEMLLVVNGQRIPSEVYADFRHTVMQILGLIDEDDSPNQRASTSVEAEVNVEQSEFNKKGSGMQKNLKLIKGTSQKSSSISDNILPPKMKDTSRKRFPSFVWVLGGPGSNKAIVCNQAVRKMRNWVHLSLGSLLVTLAASNSKIHKLLVTGELVPTDMVMQLIEQQVLKNSDCRGIVIDGFPRNLKQVREFQNKFGQKPEILLLDVSKHQVSRGRLYDGAEAFQRRLELFRELTLPMLKSLDAEGRLSILDGDTELATDRQQFASALLELMRRASRNENDPNRISVLQSEFEDENSEELRTQKKASDEMVSVVNGHDSSSKNSSIGGQSQLLDNNLLPSSRQNARLRWNGIQQLLPNGIAARMTNGFLPSSNRVAPVTSTSRAPVPVDTLTRMTNEIQEDLDSPPTNLHI